jgi:competence protein ComEC
MLYFAAVGFTSVLATAATGPFAIYHFNRFAVYGVAANFIAVPATALWIMPWGLAAFLLMPLGLERLALIPMGWGVDLVIGTAEMVASWPRAVTPVPAMPPAGLILVILGGLWLCLWRRPWRLAGIPLVCMGLLTLALVRPPDVLVSGDGRLFAVHGPDDDLILSSDRVARFTGEVWLRRNGQKAGLSWAAEVPERLADALACDQVGCIYKSHGHVIALANDGRALAEDCRLASVVVSLEPIRGRRCREPGVVIDRFDLWREGAHALWLSPGKVRVESVRDVRGKRPWVARRGWD